MCRADYTIGYSDGLTRTEATTEALIKPETAQCSTCGIEALKTDLMRLDKKLYCPDCFDQILEQRKP